MLNFTSSCYCCSIFHHKYFVIFFLLLTIFLCYFLVVFISFILLLLKNLKSNTKSGYGVLCLICFVFRRFQFHCIRMQRFCFHRNQRCQFSRKTKIAKHKICEKHHIFLRHIHNRSLHLPL